jgi:hypothetical protein
MERAAITERRFALRNSVIDGRDTGSAISLARGVASEIVNNLILGGSSAAIGIPDGFDDLTITGNRIESAVGAVGIELGGGPGTDRIEILGNTFLHGDHGVFIRAGAIGQQGDAVLLSGNHFGEELDGSKRDAPAISAVHASGPLPSWLEFSLGLSLELNSYHAVLPGAGADIVFEPPAGIPVLQSLARLARHSREARHGP